MPDDLKENLQFGAVAIKLGMTTLERIDEALRLQAKMKEIGVPPKKLGEILAAKGYLSADQIRKVFEAQGQKGGHTQIAGYRILGKIGAGAMGAIYKALQISMDRIVAIKVLSTRYAQNPAFVERFFREARAVAKLNHPNIIQGIDVGESNGIHYFAMEFVDGPTVGDLLKRGGALDERRALHVVTQISRALQHAYVHGLLHRDIKPDNIMLTRDGVAKLCDLGLAKDVREDTSNTRQGASMGTPHYISPEQARGQEDLDIRTDLYSLGATLYHMVVGEVPYPGESAAQVIGRHLMEELPPARSRNPLVSAPVEFIVGKLMRKNRDERHQTPAELLRDLEATAAGGLPEGMEPPPVERKVSSALRLRARSKLLRRRRFR